MFLLLGFAFLAGVVTILSPCILPVLPVVLASSANSGKSRPWGVVAGFIASFSIFTLTLSSIVRLFHISPDLLRWIAAGLVIVFGVVLVIPALKDGFLRITTALTSRLSQPQSAVPGKPRGGFWSGVVLGASLGVVWTPCVGPIMASVITLALSQTVDLGGVFITLAYATGTAVPLFLLIQGGRSLLTRFPFFIQHSAGLQRFFGALMILTGVTILSGFDRTVQTWLLQTFPKYGSGLTAIEDQKVVRQAIARRQNELSNTPERSSLQTTDPLTLGNGAWFNSPPLTLEGLKGKVVLVDFWTYSCVNCLRTLPYLKSWYQRYHDQGLVIVGVHSPEFAFEHQATNVRRAIGELSITWPVVQDNHFGIWNAFQNRYWPAEYLFDRTGKLVEKHFGEGGYRATETHIQDLLNMKGPLSAAKVVPTLPTDSHRSPETYLGWERSHGYTGTGPVVPDKLSTYHLAGGMLPSTWGLDGHWMIEKHSIINTGHASIVYRFTAQNVYLVINPIPSSPSNIWVSVDGQPTDSPDVRQGVLKLDGDRLYQVYQGKFPKTATLRLDFTGPVRLFAFTFG